MNNNTNKIVRIATHNGVFHSDEAMAIALIKYYHHLTNSSAKIVIVRSRDEDIINNSDMVIDVGGVYSPKDGLFDHHQESYRGKLSSAGMLLSYLSQSWFEYSVNTGYELCDFVDLDIRILILNDIDLNDNGIEKSNHPVIRLAQLSNPEDISKSDIEFEVLVNKYFKLLRGLISIEEIELEVASLQELSDLKDNGKL